MHTKISESHTKCIFILVFFGFKNAAIKVKFSIIGRSHLSKSLSDLAKPRFSARFSVEYLRPEVRGVLVVVAAGEGIHPEIVRVNLAGCLKLAALRAVLYTIPSKDRGLRIQSSDVVLGEPGLGKGLGVQ